MKTLDIKAKEWFDKVNGNSYFAAIITVDYALPTEKQFKLPFQYGYGNQFEYESTKELQRQNVLPTPLGDHLGSYCKDNGIILRMSKDKALKRELVNI